MCWWLWCLLLGPGASAAQRTDAWICSSRLPFFHFCVRCCSPKNWMKIGFCNISAVHSSSLASNVGRTWEKTAWYTQEVAAVSQQWARFQSKVKQDGIYLSQLILHSCTVGEWKYWGKAGTPGCPVLDINIQRSEAFCMKVCQFCFSPQAFNIHWLGFHTWF